MFVWSIGRCSHSALISAGLDIPFSQLWYSFQQVRRPLPSLDQLKCLIERAKEAHLTHGISLPGGSRFIRGYGLCRNRARSPRAPAHVRAIRGTLVLLLRPSVCLSARRRDDASHATLARAASHGCFGELLAGGSSERPCPVR